MALAVIIACLALVILVGGVQAFDELAAHGGGKPVLPLNTLIDDIAKNPAAPDWWTYALLIFAGVVLGVAAQARSTRLRTH